MNPINKGKSLPNILDKYEVKSRPTPDQFDVYLPWMCGQLEMYLDIIVIRQAQKLVVIPKSSDKTKNNKNQVRYENFYSTEKMFSPNNIHINVKGTVKIYTIYDSNNNLVQIKFDKNELIPKEIFKTIGLLSKYHNHLTSIVMNQGLNKKNINELSKLLTLTNITELCLDNTKVPNGNYEIFLDNVNSLMHLSLSRCAIDDNIVKNIAFHLSYPLPASQTLSVLNLAMNKITKVGAKYLAKALRTNKQLAYLNLTDNLIEDEGAMAILEVLNEFLMSKDEVNLYISKYMEVCKAKLEILLAEPAKQMEERRKSLKKMTSYKTVVPAKSKSKVNKGNKGHICNKGKKISENDHKKGPSIVKVVELFDSKNPFCPENVIVRNGKTFCYGNNHLAYLNISYNNISDLTVKKLLAVLLTQKNLCRKPTGLVKVSIEGNCILEDSVEIKEIENILKTSLKIFSKGYSHLNNRIGSKFTFA